MRCPLAQWRGDHIPSGNTGGLTRAYHGLILHVMEGSMASADSWFHNPSSKVSAHFGVDKAGFLVQWVDTDTVAYAEGAGNPFWASVETEGHATEALTDSQIASLAHLYAWGHGLYSWPFATTDDPSGFGLGWHGMGGGAWGGHPSCPGDLRKAQRSQVIAMALGGDMPLTDADKTFIDKTVAKWVNAREDVTDQKIDAIKAEVDAIKKKIQA